MGDVINFEEEARKRQVDKMILTMGGMNYDARNIAGSYYQLMLEDPLKAIKELSLYIDKARDINPKVALRRWLAAQILAGQLHCWTYWG